MYNSANMVHHDLSLFVLHRSRFFETVYGVQKKLSLQSGLYIRLQDNCRLFDACLVSVHVGTEAECRI